MINHNILAKIIDKVALNQWKDRVKKIKQFYYRIYFFEASSQTLKDIAGTSSQLCMYCLKGPSYLRYSYNYRKLSNLNFESQFRYIYHQRFKKCDKCMLKCVPLNKHLNIIHPDYRKIE